MIERNIVEHGAIELQDVIPSIVVIVEKLGRERRQQFPSAAFRHMGELLLASPCPEIPARPKDLNLTCREENKTQEPKIEIIRPPAVISAPPAITGMLGVCPNFTRAIICAHKKNNTT
jgi:hypothetical protein